MRVGIIGQAAFGEAVLKRLHDDGLEVIAVSAPEPAPGARPDPLWGAAETAGIPRVDTASLRHDAGLAAWNSLRADLVVMAFVTQILPEEVFRSPPLGAIQYHPSLLPLHRGSSAMNWAIINGDAETGLTVFWPDSGIDTGAVLLQEPCQLGPDDTVGSLYFERLFPMGVDALSRSVALVQQGEAPRTGQDHAAATYEPPIGDEHAEIAWHEPAIELYARIRGCNPQPGAWTMFEGARLRVFDCRLLGAREPGMPGRVLRSGADGVDIRLNGDVLRVLRVQPAGSKKMPAAEWAAAAGLKPGFRFRAGS